MAFSVGDKWSAAEANKRPASASGSFTMAAPSALNTPVSQVITFPAGRFATAPNVTCGVLAGTPTQFVVGVSVAPTTTGCTLAMVQTTGTLTSRTVQWIAVEPT